MTLFIVDVVVFSSLLSLNSSFVVLSIYSIQYCGDEQSSRELAEPSGFSIKNMYISIYIYINQRNTKDKIKTKCRNT